MEEKTRRIPRHRAEYSSLSLLMIFLLAGTYSLCQCISNTKSKETSEYLVHITLNSLFQSVLKKAIQVTGYSRITSAGSLNLGQAT